MKKKIVILGICLCLAMSIPVQAVITGSAHDFATAWAGEVCKACHTPHNAQAVTDAPLWNHTVTVATHVPYSSPTLDAAVPVPSGTSKLCLSCHDGTVYLDALGGNAGSAGVGYIGVDDNLGIDLSDEHPISFTYDAALGGSGALDEDLYDPTTQTSGLGGTITEDMLTGGKLECSSCHDVHNGAGTTGKLLVKANTNSALCLTCHNK